MRYFCRGKDCNRMTEGFADRHGKLICPWCGSDQLEETDQPWASEYEEMVDSLDFLDRQLFDPRQFGPDED